MSQQLGCLYGSDVREYAKGSKAIVTSQTQSEVIITKGSVFDNNIWQRLFIRQGTEQMPFLKWHLFFDKPSGISTVNDCSDCLPVNSDWHLRKSPTRQEAPLYTLASCSSAASDSVASLYTSSNSSILCSLLDLSWPISDSEIIMLYHFLPILHTIFYWIV